MRSHMKKTRQANFELLRIVAMLMVIALHYLVKGGVAYSFVGKSTPVNYFAWLLEAFCLVAVNCYVLISGYFLVESEWRPGRTASLLCQVLFYSLLIPLAFMLVGVIPFGSVSLYEWVEYVFPISTEHYWFATAYVLMYLFAPLLGAGIRQMDKRQMQVIIGLLLFFFCLVKSVVPIFLAADRFGYDFGWFLCLFVIAGYIRRFGIPWLEKKSHAAVLYVLTAAATWGVSMACRILGERFGILESYADTPYTYNHIFCLIGAVSLFYVFKDSNIREGKVSEIICRLAPYTFGVYLLHEHKLVRYLWPEWAHVEAVTGSWSFIPHMLGCIVLVYGIGSVVDFIRAKLFLIVGNGVKGYRDRK